MLLGKRNYQTHDESDAVAIALCHTVNRTNKLNTNKTIKKTGSSLKNSLAHKIGTF